MRLFQKTIEPRGKTHSATVIFFHGSGDTGPNLLDWVRFLLGRDMEFPHIKIIYPTAPLQPYTPNNGEPSNVWFDRRAVTIEALENRRSLSSIYETVHELVSEEVSQGIPLNRIIVGGFSMGGALAMHSAFHLSTEFAGVFACSSFLNRDSIVYETLKYNSQRGTILPELLMFHGVHDKVVPIAWAEETFSELTKHGVRGQFRPLPNALHELKQCELKELHDWISSKLPALASDYSYKL